MTPHNEKYLIDSSGNKTAVLLDITEYEKILDDLEELDSIKAYDEAKTSNDEVIPFDQAIKEIDEGK